MRKVKDKGRAVSVPMPNPEINTTGTGTADEPITDAGNSSQSNDNSKDWPTFPVARLPSRNTSSKYDFVKVNFVFPFNSLLLCWFNCCQCKNCLNFGLIWCSLLISLLRVYLGILRLWSCIVSLISIKFLLHVVAWVCFWQVKVWLGDNADHYYVLSRFLLSRMLTVTKVQVHPIFKEFWSKRLCWHRAFIDVLFLIFCLLPSYCLICLSRSLSSLLRVKFLVLLLSSLCLGSKGNVGVFYTGWFESSIYINSNSSNFRFQIMLLLKLHWNSRSCL